ncbi:PREDICTED: uncharacterized protein LOC109334030 [Lupinus angustifolius]|uniref:uncharacterized protein LOC109334030 n=1 Tax=Lupinus angustifolius TaxID=3871 RepID=UPI00092F6291|nr:PREDICTED: uncharacterized protein LOC109334030 [Lupinus angustifolius]
MPTYMLSIFKAPKKVVSKLTSLQRNFLWNKNSGGRGIPWIAWSEVCKPKRLGGLGVKDLSRFNDALLGKWKWRKLVDTDTLWVRVIDSRYDTNGVFNSIPSASRWWRDLVKIGSGSNSDSNWLDDNLWKEIGDGLTLVFGRIFGLAIKP